MTWPRTKLLRYVANLLAVVLLLLATGCVSLRRPQGEWAQALDLNVPKGALRDVDVGVDCATRDIDQVEGPAIDPSTGKPLTDPAVALPAADRAASPTRLEPANLVACKRIAEILKNLGARVQAPPGLLPPVAGAEADQSDQADEEDQDQPPRAFTLRWVDLGGYRDYGGWTLPACILTLTLFPCVEDISVSASLEVLDDKGMLAARYPMEVAIRKVYGVPALYLLAVRGLAPERGRYREHAWQQSLLDYIRDVAYTYRQRQKLAAGAAL